MKSRTRPGVPTTTSHELFSSDITRRRFVPPTSKACFMRGEVKCCWKREVARVRQEERQETITSNKADVIMKQYSVDITFTPIA